MDHSILERIRKAKSYQQKALLALFPENMAGHLETIGREWDAIIIECAAEWITRNTEKANPENDCRTEKPGQESCKSGNRTGARKVSIE